MGRHTIPICSLITSYIVFVSTGDPLVKLTCETGCVASSKGLVAYSGTQIKLKYTVDDRLCILEVRYNYELIINTYEPHLCRLDVRAVIGRDPRIEYLSDLIRVHNTFVYEFRLRDLSVLKDNGRRFEFLTDLKDGFGRNVTGSDVLTVLEPTTTMRTTMTQTTTEKTSTTELPSSSKPTFSPDAVKISTSQTTMKKVNQGNTTTMSLISGPRPTDNATGIVVQVGATMGANDDYPWPVVIGIICGSIFVILLVVAVLLAVRCRRAENPGYRYGTANAEEEGTVTDNEMEAEKTPNGTTEHDVVVHEQPVLTEIPHLEITPCKEDTKNNGSNSSELNGTLKNGDIQHESVDPHDDVFVNFEQGGAGQPQLVYAAADDVEEDLSRFASLSNQPLVGLEELEDLQRTLNESLLSDISSPLIDNNNEHPYAAVIRNKPPSDVIEPPFDIIEPPCDVIEPTFDFTEPTSDDEIDINQHIVSV